MRGSGAFRAAVAPGGGLAGPWVRDPLWRRAKAVPSIDLRFAERKSLVDAVTGQSLVTFTRSSSATYTDSDGVLRTASTDVPRFDHNPTTGECLGLLVEEQRTNLLLRSEQFDDASWNSSAGARTVTANDTTAPDGTNTADKVTADGSNASHFVSQSVTLSAQPYSLSVFAKKGTEEVFVLRVFTALGGALARFNLTTGAVISFSSTTASITQLPNGWYRCAMTFTPLAATGGLGLYIGSESANTGTGFLYLWGAQLETGAFSTSYIPTTSSTVTRSADVASITGTAFSSWYQQSPGSIYAEWKNDITGAGKWGTLMQVDDGTTNNYINMNYRSPGAKSIRLNMSSSGAYYSATTIGTYTPGTIARSIIAYAPSDLAITLNQTGIGASSTAVLPTVNQAAIGFDRSTGDYFCGTIRRLTYWPRRLPDVTLQALTQ